MFPTPTVMQNSMLATISTASSPVVPSSIDHCSPGSLYENYQSRLNQALGIQQHFLMAPNRFQPQVPVSMPLHHMPPAMPQATAPQVVHQIMARNAGSGFAQNMFQFPQQQHQQQQPPHRHHQTAPATETGTPTMGSYHSTPLLVSNHGTPHQQQQQAEMLAFATLDHHAGFDADGTGVDWAPLGSDMQGHLSGP
jgi:hypothetical protein